MPTRDETRRDPPPGERTAAHRIRLQQVASSLAGAVEPRAVARALLDAACEELDAPEGWVVGLTEDGRAAEMLAATGFEPDLLEPWLRVPLSIPVPMTEVIRTGTPRYHRTAAERRAEFPALLGPQTARAASEGSAVLPLGQKGASLGAFAVSFAEPRELDPDERWFLESLAATGSHALERARLFARLRDRDARLRFTLEASGTATFEWDFARDTIEWSPGIPRLLGIRGTPPSDVAGWLELIHPDDLPHVRAAIRDCLRSGRTRDAEFRVRLGDTVRWIHAAGRMVRGTDGHPARILGTGRDITDRRLAEAERDQMVEAEREAARLRDAFIGVVSHELRTPITTIFGGTRVLARRWREMGEQDLDALLGDITEEADRLYRLVEDLLVLTRVERGTLDVGDEPVHVGRLVDRVVASERPRWPGVRFEVAVPPGLPTAAGEDAYLEQVLRNLLGNAAKYGGAPSTVRVEADSDPHEVRLQVLDDGPGVDPAELDQLFELFYRSPATTSLAGGAGIGLFVCRQLVAAMGGTITAGPRPGGGTAFTVSLPRSRDDEGGGDDGHP